MAEQSEYDLGDLSTLEEGELTVREAGDTEILLCRVEGTVYAIEDLCSHADTPLSEGRLSGFHINCPLHGASFDIRDGSHSGPPAYTGVKCFKTKEADGSVIVEIGSNNDEPKDEPTSGFFQTR